MLLSMVRTASLVVMVGADVSANDIKSGCDGWC